MTERDYIDATNLAKLRMARTILRDVLFMAADDARRFGDVLLAVDEMIEPLEKRMDRDA